MRGSSRSSRPPGVAGAGVGRSESRRGTGLLRSTGTAIELASSLMAVAVLAGVLVAALLLPVVAGVGLAARNGIKAFDALPSQLADPQLPTISTVRAADGTLLARYYTQNRVEVKLDQVPMVMRNALISIEDSRFYSHHGVDVRGMLRAAVENSRNGTVVQGGSTLTQQYVKNVRLLTARTAAQRRDAVDDTLSRKVSEAADALSLEKVWSKDKILEHYLNIAYFGAGAYGVGAAAQRYFGLTVDRLDLPQAAMLAGLVQNPSAYDPIEHPGAAVERRNTVLERMGQLTRQSGVTPEQAAEAERAPLGLRPTTLSRKCVTSTAGFFCDQVEHEIEYDPAYSALGATPGERMGRLERGGLTVVTSLQPKVQRAAQSAVDGTVPPSSPFAAVIDAVEPGTGRIFAMAVNKPFGVKGGFSLNLATGGQVGYQAGSTFKPFVLAAALQQGIPLNTVINAPAKYESEKFARYNHGVPYPVENAGDSEAGDFSLSQCTWESVNTCYIQLEERTGLDLPVKIASDLGVRQFFPNGQGPLLAVPTFTLGLNEISPLAMAGAYAGFAAHGKFCPPHAVLAIYDTDGHRVGGPPPKCTQALDPKVADTVTSVLTGVIDGPQAKTGGAASIGRPAAGKTGTVDQYRGAWFDGFVPQLSAVAWMGNPLHPSTSRLADVTVDGRYYSAIFGGTLPAPMWADFMRTALADVPVKDFAGADPALAVGRSTGVPGVSGMSYDSAVATLQAAGFQTALGYPVSAGGYAGTVAWTSPGAGSAAPPGSTVTIYLTVGRRYVPVPAPAATYAPPKKSRRTSAPPRSPPTPPARTKSPKPTKPPRASVTPPPR